MLFSVTAKIFAGILSRIRNTQEQSYKVDDILDIDKEMQMNGIIFSV